MRELHFNRSAATLTVTLGEYHDDIAWADVALNEGTGQHIYDDAANYGRTLFERVFRNEQLRSALVQLPTNERLVLIAEQPEVAAIPWEYLRDTNDMLIAARLNLVRGVAEHQRRAPVALTGPLHLIAVPSSPVDEPHVLNTEREWSRLVEVVNSVAKDNALTLTRVRPPTLTQMELTLPGEGMTLLHFMGHSSIANSGTAKEVGVLAFEDQLGRSQAIRAPYFADSLNSSVFLVVLNSCLSAVVSLTEFGNIAHALVTGGVPYALGMQFVLLDDVALEMSKTLYTFLLQRRSVEEAVRLTRRSLEQQTHLHHPLWLAGIPVLYTNQREPASLVKLATGHPTLEPDPKQLQETCDVTGLPPAEHFVGRGEQISEALKDRLLALSFETFARVDSEDRITVNETFADGLYNRLARYYGLDPSLYQTPVALQHAILQQRAHTRSLLILDNLETLVDALANGDERAKAQATPLATFISRLKEGDGAILLTSRSIPPVDWGQCHVIHLSGLKDDVGTQLFLSLLPEGHRSLAPVAECVNLSQRVQGHPLSIRLLAKRFAERKEDLAHFLASIENELRTAEQSASASLADPARQKTLYACMHYSFQRLTPEQQQVLSTVSIFLAPFLPTFASSVLDDEEQTPTHLQELERLGLLEFNPRSFPEGRVELYDLHSMLRWYLHQRLPSLTPELQERYGQVYVNLARQAYQTTGGADQSAAMRYLIRQSLPDCEAAFQYLPANAKSALAYYLAEPYQRLGNVRHALSLLEQALQIDQGLGDVRSIAVTEARLAQLLFQQGEQARALSLAWHAYTCLDDHGYTRDAHIMQEILASLKERFAETAHFDALWEQAVYEPQPDWLRAVLPGEHGTDNASDTTDETIQAIREFVNADDWDATRQVVEARRDILFKLETEATLEAFIAQAEAAHDEREEKLFEMHLDVLRACKSLGIAETFRQLASARQQSIAEDKDSS